MKNYARALGIVGVILALLIVSLLALRMYGTSADSGRKSDAPRDPSSPPADFGKNPTSSKQYVADTMCRSDCESAARTCRATADGPEAQAACDVQLQTCVAACK